MENYIPAPGDDEERLARIQLYRTRNVGPTTFRKLLGRFGTAKASLEALPDLARRGGMRSHVPYPQDRAAAEISKADAAGAAFIHMGEELFPDLLAEADDAPPFVAAIGNVSLLRQSALAIVGARNASANGRTLATTFACDLSEAGYVIVSGMARGIDTAAHAGALNGGTIAVLAGGVDIIYPHISTGKQEPVPKIGERRAHPIGNADRHETAGTPLPAPEQDHLGPFARRGGYRSRRAVRIADHGPIRCRTGARRPGRARLPSRSPHTWRGGAHPRRRDTRHVHRAYFGSARPSLFRRAPITVKEHGCRRGAESGGEYGQNARPHPGLDEFYANTDRRHHPVL